MTDASTFREHLGEPPYTITDIRCWPRLGEPRDVLTVDRQGRVQHIGPRANIDYWEGPTVSGHGSLLLPGFVDPHLHVRASASARASIDISSVERTDQVLDIIRTQARTTDEWISLWGLQPELLVGKPLTAQVLDQASGGRPVRIRHRSTHAWVFSATALRRFGIAEYDSGLIVERGGDSEPTGHVVDHSGRIGDLIGAVTPRRQLTDEVKAWSRELARNGVVAFVDATARNGPAELGQLADWATNGTIVQRVGAMGSLDVASAPPPLRFVGHKLMPAFGEDLQAWLTQSWAQDLPVAVHCVEVEELARVIEAVEAIPAGARGSLRIEHASRTPKQWIDRVKQLGASVVTHPAFVHAHGDRYLADPELAPHDWLYRLRSWRDAGVPLAFASDAPAGPTSPLLHIRCATQRTTRSGAVLGTSEAVSLDVAVACATSEAASIATLADEGFGALAIGTSANAVLVQLGPSGLDDPASHVLATLVNGQVIT